MESRKPPPLEDRIRQLRDSITEAQGRKARAEHELDLAENRRDAALKALEEEFGVSDTESARRLLEQAEADLAAECSQVEQALREAG